MAEAQTVRDMFLEEFGKHKLGFDLLEMNNGTQARINPGQLDEALTPETPEERDHRQAITLAHHGVYRWFSYLLTSHNLFHSDSLLCGSTNYDEAGNAVRYAMGMAQGNQSDRLPVILKASACAMEAADSAYALESGKTKNIRTHRRGIALNTAKLFRIYTREQKKSGEADTTEKQLQDLLTEMIVDPRSDKDHLMNRHFRSNAGGAILTQMQTLTDIKTKLRPGTTTDPEAVSRKIDHAQTALKEVLEEITGISLN